MAIMRRNDALPIRTVRPFQDEMNRLFDDFFGATGLVPQQGDGTWNDFIPALDVTETPEAIQVAVEVPGMSPEEIDVNLHGTTLTLKGEKKRETEQKDRNYLRVERSHGRFMRSINLPDDIDPERIDATCKAGVLTVTVGKSERAKPRNIEVKVND